MELNNLKCALVLAPHTDDAEFGCGGTISKLLDMGVEVNCAVFSACQQSVRPEFPSDILITEFHAASDALGIGTDKRFLYEYDVRTFNFNRQHILDDLIKLRNTVKPDLVFLPSLNDIHQDHATICDEGIRAFKFSSILCYEMPWNNFHFSTTCFIQLSESDLQGKIDAISVYKSQAHRPYANGDFIKSLAVTRGVQSGHKYAEAFEVVRWIIK